MTQHYGNAPARTVIIGVEMAVNETIALIRDISVIIAAGVFTAILLAVGYVLMRLYPLTRRTLQSVEQTSSMVHSMVSQPLGLVSGVVELLNRVLAMVNHFRSRNQEVDDVEE